MGAVSTASNEVVVRGRRKRVRGHSQKLMGQKMLTHSPGASQLMYAYKSWNIIGDNPNIF
jgi:hypothetical protein